MDVRRGWLLVPASFFQSLERPIAIVTDVCRELTLQDEAIEEVAAAAEDAEIGPESAVEVPTKQ